MTARSTYIHGDAPDERRRLATLNQLLNDACVREARIAAGEQILDVGGGLGQLSRALARAAGRPVVAIERSPAQIAEARRMAVADGDAPILDIREGDALDLPLRPEEWGTFDVAHARFLLEHVREPQRVVAQMVRAVRPGGRLILCDDDHSLMRLTPEPPGFQSIWDAFVGTYERNGNDPWVGRRLTSLLAAAGAAPRRATWIFFGASAGEETFAGLAANLAGNLSGAREAIVSGGTVSAADVDRVVDDVLGLGTRPEAMIGYAMPWVEGVRGPFADWPSRRLLKSGTAQELVDAEREEP